MQNISVPGIWQLLILIEIHWISVNLQDCIGIGNIFFLSFRPGRSWSFNFQKVDQTRNKVIVEVFSKRPQCIECTLIHTNIPWKRGSTGKESSILFPLTWSKAPLANLLISWVLPHSVSPTTTTDNPDIFTYTCQWSFCDFLKEFLEVYVYSIAEY